MNEISAITLFCEDVRFEKYEMNSLIGILPDNLNVPQVPGIMPKLAIYTRIKIDTELEPDPISITLDYPNGEKDLLTNIDPNIVNKARRNALDKEAPIFGLISRTIIAPFQVKEEGRIIARVSVGDADFISGILNFLVQKEAEKAGS